MPSIDTRTAPTRTIIRLDLLMPEKMKKPSPPAATNEAKAATLTPRTTAFRTPAMIIGSERGIFTFHMTCESDIPIPRAASISDGLIWFKAICVFRRIGRSEYMVIAITAGASPRPNRKGANNTTMSANRAKLGIVIRTPAIDVTICANLGLDETKRPRGTLTRTDIGKAMAMICICRKNCTTISVW